MKREIENRPKQMYDEKFLASESKPKFDESELDGMFDMPTNMPTMEMLASAGLSPTGRKRSAIDKQLMYMHGASPRQMGKSLQQTLQVDMAKAEQLMKEFTSSNLCQELYLDKTSKPCQLAEMLGFPKYNNTKLTGIKEKPMSLKVTRPVLIGTVNILTAQTFELDAIIREAQLQIKANEDLQELSQHHKNMKTELEEVIKLCVEQLDKGLEKKESLVS